MNAVWYRARAELRARRRGAIGLALLIAVIAGVVLSLAAGARRTDTAYDRLVSEQRTVDVALLQNGPGSAGTAASELARLPSVVGVHRAQLFSAVDGRTSDGLQIAEPDYVSTYVPVGAGSATGSGTKLLHGRDARTAGEAVAGFRVADRYHLDVGDTVVLNMLRAGGETFPVSNAAKPGDDVLPVRLRIVGIEAVAGEFPPAALGQGAGSIRLSHAFLTAHAQDLEAAPVVGLHLRHGAADVSAFRRELERRGFDRNSFTTLDTQHASTRRALELQAQALAMLAVLGGVAGLLVLAQALARQAYLDADDHATLRALGVSRAQLIAVTVARTVPVAAVGAVLGMVFAVALSPLFPVGIARIAEPNPGVRVDALVLVVGAAVLVAAIVAATTVPAWLAARRLGAPVDPALAGTTRPSRVAEQAAHAGLPPVMVTGLRMALEPGRGRSAVPIRSTAMGVVLGIAAVTAAVTFVAGLDKLVDTPRLYGWNWDFQVGDGYGRDFYDDVVPVLEREPAVEGLTAAALSDLRIGGHTITALAALPVKGDVQPTVVRGRAPTLGDEIALTRQEMDAANTSIGQTVDVTHGRRTRTYMVVGRVVLPQLGSGEFGHAAYLSYDGLRRLDPSLVPRNIFLVRWSPGTSDATRARIERSLPLYSQKVLRPTDLVNFGRVEGMPLIGGGLLALVAAAMLAHTLVTSIRRRRRDLAILKTLGFVRGQVSAAVAWQASTLALLAVIFGLPIGVAAGRALWTLFAQRLGVVAEPVTAPLVLLAIPATVLVANLVAAIPAALAARTHPALVLRTE